MTGGTEMGEIRDANEVYAEQVAQAAAAVAAAVSTDAAQQGASGRWLNGRLDPVNAPER